MELSMWVSNIYFTTFMVFANKTVYSKLNDQKKNYHFVIDDYGVKEAIYQITMTGVDCN